MQLRKLPARLPTCVPLVSGLEIAGSHRRIAKQRGSMNEALTFGAFMMVPGAALLVHRAGLVYSIRMIANWWYALAFAVEHFRAEFRRLNDEARRA